MIGRLTRSASLAFGENAQHFDSQASLIAALRKELQRDAGAGGLTVLVKGSRSSAMDRVVAALLAGNQEESGHAA